MHLGLNLCSIVWLLARSAQTSLIPPSFLPSRLIDSNGGRKGERGESWSRSHQILIRPTTTHPFTHFQPETDLPKDKLRGRNFVECKSENRPAFRSKGLFASLNVFLDPLPLLPYFFLHCRCRLKGSPFSYTTSSFLSICCGHWSPRSGGRRGRYTNHPERNGSTYGLFLPSSIPHPTHKGCQIRG